MGIRTKLIKDLMSIAEAYKDGEISAIGTMTDMGLLLDNFMKAESQKSAIPNVRLVFRDSYGNEITDGDTVVIENDPACKSDNGGIAKVIWDEEYGLFRYKITNIFPYHISDFRWQKKFRKITKNGA